MIVRGVEFGHAWIGSGTQGFFGEGYPFHRYWRLLGLRFKGSTFVAKTMTLEPRKGNMPFRKGTIQPQEWKPKCIIVKPLQGVVLNAVDLSNPGAEALFKDGRWQQRTKPFFLSFAPVMQGINDRLDEVTCFRDLFEEYRPGFLARVGLQLNYSCPNVAHEYHRLVEEVRSALDILDTLHIPIVLKFGPQIPIEHAVEISKHRACDGLSISQSIPWGEFPDQIDWEGIFGSKESPLAKLGFPKGALSGKPVLPIVLDWLKRGRKLIKKPINAGGGVMSKSDVYRLYVADADSISFACAAILRPWRVRGIIREANENFGYRQKVHFEDRRRQADEAMIPCSLL